MEQETLGLSQADEPDGLSKLYEERLRCFGYSLTDLDWIGPMG